MANHLNKFIFETINEGVSRQQAIINLARKYVEEGMSNSSAIDTAIAEISAAPFAKSMARKIWATLHKTDVAHGWEDLLK